VIETTEVEGLLPLVERLGGRDWADVGQAFQSLAAAGEAGRAAVEDGLTHPRPRVRAACADFYDHLGREEDVPVLCGLLDDPVPSVRRQAVHSLACQRCKPAPLQADLTETLIGLALHDPTPRVRREAVYGLSARPSDPRIIAALERIVATDPNAKVVREAQAALERQSPAHRQAAIEAAKARQRFLRNDHDAQNNSGD
jgi:HEAT repeat protein